MIDPRAVIDPDARIAAGVHVGPYSVIGPDVEIGEGTWIGPHVVLNGPTRIGCDNRVHQFCSLGDDPPGQEYRGARLRPAYRSGIGTPSVNIAP